MGFGSSGIAQQRSVTAGSFWQALDFSAPDASGDPQSLLASSPTLVSGASDWYEAECNDAIAAHFDPSVPTLDGAWFQWALPEPPEVPGRWAIKFLIEIDLTQLLKAGPTFLAVSAGLCKDDWNPAAPGSMVCFAGGLQNNLKPAAYSQRLVTHYMDGATNRGTFGGGTDYLTVDYQPIFDHSDPQRIEEIHYGIQDSESNSYARVNDTVVTPNTTFFASGDTINLIAWIHTYRETSDTDGGKIRLRVRYFLIPDID